MHGMPARAGVKRSQGRAPTARFWSRTPARSSACSAPTIAAPTAAATAATAISGIILILDVKVASACVFLNQRRAAWRVVNHHILPVREAALPLPTPQRFKGLGNTG